MTRVAALFLVFAVTTATSWLLLFAVFVGEMELLGRYLEWTFSGGGERVVALALASLFCGGLVAATAAIVMLTRTRYNGAR